jgi:hypothetical protein
MCSRTGKKHGCTTYCHYYGDKQKWLPKLPRVLDTCDPSCHVPVDRYLICDSSDLESYVTMTKEGQGKVE